MGDFADVQHQPPFPEMLQLVVQGGRAVGGVEIMDLAAPVVREAGNLLRGDSGPGGHDDPVIVISAFLADYLTVFRIHGLDGVQHKIDAVHHKIFFGANAALRRIHAKRHQQPAGLIVVDGVAVNESYLPLPWAQELSHLRGHHGPAGAGAQE